MEAVERRRQEQDRDRRQEREQNGGRTLSRSLSLSGESYWLDLWLFVLFDLALFVVIYLLP